MLRGTPEHPKTAALMALLSIGRAQAVGHLEMLWHFASVYAPVGDIGRWPDAAIEAACSWEGDPGALVAALVACRWLDPSDEHRLAVHDWHEHSDRYVRRKVARKGQEILRVTSVDARQAPKGRPEGTPAGAVAGIQSQCQSQYPVPVPEPAAAAPSAPADVPAEASASDDRDPGQLWETAKTKLSGVVPVHSFGTWFRPLTAARWDDGTLVIEVPNAQFHRWLSANFREQVRHALDALEYRGPIRFATRARDPAELELHEGSVR